MHKLIEFWNERKSTSVMAHSGDDGSRDDGSKVNHKAESGPLSSIIGTLKSVKSAGGELKKSISIHKKSKSNNGLLRPLSPNLISLRELNEKEEQNEHRDSEAVATSITKRFSERVSVLLKNPSKLISSEPIENPSEETAARFRQYFALKNERLHARKQAFDDYSYHHHHHYLRISILMPLCSFI